MNNNWPFSTPGIPDDLFVRNEVPMTKEEIRALTLAKARLAPRQIVWDIGSGTGSIAVEAALLVPGGTVYAIERNSRGIDLIKQNAQKFAISNLVPIHGEAPAVLHNLPDPHRIIIGGSGGQLSEIFQLAKQRLKPGGRIVVNAVTLETFALCTKLIAQWHYNIIQVNISRTVKTGRMNMWRALNPIYIVTAVKDSEDM